MTFKVDSKGISLIYYCCAFSFIGAFRATRTIVARLGDDLGAGSIRTCLSGGCGCLRGRDSGTRGICLSGSKLITMFCNVRCKRMSCCSGITRSESVDSVGRLGERSIGLGWCVGRKTISSGTTSCGLGS